MISDATLTIAALWLGSLFAYSGSIKLLASSEHNVRAVQGYQLVPLGVARVLAAALPYAELVVAGLILVTPFLRIGAGVAAGFGVVFAIASGSVLTRRIDTACGCAGAASERVQPATLMRALAVTVAGVAVMVAGSALPVAASAFALMLAIAPAVLMLRQRREARSGSVAAVIVAAPERG